MVNMPEHLLIATAEKRAKALGISIKQAIAELKGESKPTIIQKIPKKIECLSKHYQYPHSQISHDSTGD